MNTVKINRKNLIQALCLICVCIEMLVLSSPARGDYPIDVQRLHAEGDYFAAMLAFERMPKRISTTPATLAAAQSAWALSLPKIAIDRFELVLRDQNLSDSERSKVELSRGIIELQEGNPQGAILFAERALKKLPSISTLRSKVWLLWAESLMRAGSLGAAEEKYKNAIGESSTEDMPEVQFLLARCQYKLGHLRDAIHNLSRIPLNHQRTAEAMRSLAEISLQNGDEDQAAFWLETGRSKFPEKFLDGWVDYARVAVAVKNSDRKTLDEILIEASNKYPPSDPWRTLLEAKAESYFWSLRQKGATHE